MKLWLPFPISVNRLYPGRIKRHKSKEYVEWIREAGQILRTQPCSRQSFHEPVSITYKFGQPDKRRRDIDNLFKCCNDLLVAAAILRDDSLIHRISGEWADITGTECEIRTVANPLQISNPGNPPR